jgi:dolichol-phosphate mannosyltransferase
MLAVIIPTFNERETLPLLLEKLESALVAIDWEAIIVDDDSPDGTAALGRALAADDPRIRVIQRIGRRGLSTAVIEGMLATRAEYLAVIDADMQHDETLLPQMLGQVASGDADIVVGTRYGKGGDVGDWSARRERLSRWATRLAQRVTRVPLTDPMSGFFLIRREAFEARMRGLSGEGYKVLLDLFATGKTPLRFAELPYRFRARQFGTSKLDTLVVWEFVALLLDKSVGHLVPVRLLMFAMVGGLGFFVHAVVMTVLFQGLAVPFAAAQTFGALVAMTSNFLLNNLFTYRDRRLRGWRLAWGLISFYAVCSIGLIGNVGVAETLYADNTRWWLASLAGVAIGLVWNYAATRLITWRARRAQA